MHDEWHDAQPFHVYPFGSRGGLASLDLISRMLRKETPAVRFAAVHRYDEPMTIMLVPLTEAERPALIADFQESFEHFQGNPQGSSWGSVSPRASSLLLDPARAVRLPSRFFRCPTLRSP